MRAHWILLLALVVACGDEPAPTDDDATTSSDDNDDSTAAADDDNSGDDDTVALPEQVVGQVTLLRWQADALFGWPELHLHGLFSQNEGFDALAEGGVEDLLGALALGGLDDVWLPEGFWPLGQPGDVLPFEVSSLALAPAELSTAHVGDWIAVGEHAVAHLDELTDEAGLGSYYVQELDQGVDVAEREPFAQPLDLEIEGGDDFGALTLPGALRPVEPLELSGRDPSRPLPLRSGSPLELSWVADDDPSTSVLVVAVGEQRGLALHAADDDQQATLYPDELAELGQDISISVARLRRERLAAWDTRPEVVETLEITTISRLYLYPEPVGAWSVSPRLWPTGELVELDVAWHDGALDPASLYVAAGAGVTVLEAVPSDDEPARLRVTIEVASDAPGGARDLLFGDAAQDLQATAAGWVVRDLTVAGACEDAVVEGPPGVGTWVSSDAGLPAGDWDTSACPSEPTGREQAVPVHLDAGQRLTATLFGEGLVGATLYRVDDCLDIEATACVQAPTDRPWVRWQHQAPADEDFLLVLDSEQLAGSEVVSQLVLDLQIADAVPLLVDEDRLERGGSTTVTVSSLSEDWDVSSVSFDAGADVAVESVELLDSRTAELGLRAAAAGARGWRDLTVSTPAGSQTLPDAWEVADYLYLASCAEAETFEPLTAGRYPGTTLFAAFDEVSSDGCLGSSAGTEVIVPIAVGPAETLEVTLDMPGFDPVLYLMESCGDSVVACADDGGVDSPEYLRWVAPPGGGVVYLAIDGFGVDDAGEFELDVEMWR